MEWSPISETTECFVEITGCASRFRLPLTRMILQLMRQPKAMARMTATTMPAMAPGAKADEDFEIPGLAGAGRVDGVVAGALG